MREIIVWCFAILFDVFSSVRSNRCWPMPWQRNRAWCSPSLGAGTAMLWRTLTEHRVKPIRAPSKPTQWYKMRYWCWNWWFHDFNIFQLNITICHPLLQKGGPWISERLVGLVCSSSVGAEANGLQRLKWTLPQLSGEGTGCAFWGAACVKAGEIRREWGVLQCVT